MTWNVCNLELFPYRCLSCVVPLVTFFATLFFLLAAFRCSFSVSKGETGEAGLFVGLFSHELPDSSTADDRHVCVPWDADSKKELFDFRWHLGRIMAVIGVFSCLGVATLNLVLIYMRFPTTWYFQIVLAHVGNALLCFLFLIAKSSRVCRSEGKCFLGKTGYLGILAGILWLIAAFLYMLVRRVELELREDGLATDSDEENSPNRTLPPPPAPTFLPPFLRRGPWKTKKNLMEADQESPRSSKQKLSKSADLPPFDTVIEESENDSANRNSEDSGGRMKQTNTNSRDPKSPRAWKKNHQQEGMSSPRTQRNELPQRKNSTKPRRGMPSGGGNR